MFALRDVDIHQSRELANQFVALVLNRAGVLSQALHLRDLAIELRDLRGQPVDLVDGLRHRLVQPCSNRAQACYRLMKRTGKIIGGGQYRLARIAIGRIGRKLADAVEERRQRSTHTLVSDRRRSLPPGSTR